MQPIGQIENDWYLVRVATQPLVPGLSRAGTSAAASEAVVRPFTYADAISLNLAPVRFSKSTFEAGCTPYRNEAQYRELREARQATHTLRFEARDSVIYDIPMSADTNPIGTAKTLNTSEHLALLGKAINHSLLTWLSLRRTILRRARPLQSWGKRKAALLSASIREFGLTPIEGLDVLVRHSFDPRVLAAPNHGAETFLALLLDVSTSNELNIPVSQLLRDGFDPKGFYVCAKREHSDDNVLPRLETLGRVVSATGDRLRLTDSAGDELVDATEVTLEPRQENLEALLSHYYGRDSERILAGLRRRRLPFANANGKLSAIREVHEGVASRFEEISIAGMKVEIGKLLQRGDRLFPQQITTDRPGFLFGAQGRETGAYRRCRATSLASRYCS